MTTTTHRPAIERYFDLLENLDATDLRTDIERCRRALPYAKAVLLTGNVVSSGDVGPLDDFMASERARATEGLPDDPQDPEHECTIAATNEGAVYSLALVLGLLLSEVL